MDRVVDAILEAKLSELMELDPLQLSAVSRTAYASSTMASIQANKD